MTDLEQLGTEFREAKTAIGVHRVRQAEAETIYAETLRAHQYDHFAPDVQDALVAMNQAVMDVAWCQAVMIAAGEAYKGEPLEVVLARNEAHRGH